MIASDFIMSAVIFIVLLAGAALIWNATVSKYSQFAQNEFMQDKVFSITDALVRTQGYPEKWTAANVRAIGLSESESNVLNKSKLKEFSAFGYIPSKTMWGIEGYEYYIRITNSSGDIVVLDGDALEYGAMPSRKSDLVPLKRIVLINDSGILERAALQFMLWKS